MLSQKDKMQDLLPDSITNTDGISKLNHYLHDCFVDLDKTKMNGRKKLLIVTAQYIDREAESLKRKSLLIKHYEAPVYELKLLIHEVDDYTLDDNAKIGGFHVNSILYDKLGNLSLVGNEPTKLILKVRKLLIRIKPEDQKIGYVSIRRFLSIESESSLKVK